MFLFSSVASSASPFAENLFFFPQTPFFLPCHSFTPPQAVRAPPSPRTVVFMFFPCARFFLLTRAWYIFFTTCLANHRAAAPSLVTPGSKTFFFFFRRPREVGASSPFNLLPSFRRARPPALFLHQQFWRASFLSDSRTIDFFLFRVSFSYG